jgi:maleate cis-trans isomerase
MPSSTWRGKVGLIKPSYESGSLVDFIRLLPEGVGVIPLYLGIKEHNERAYREALETYHVLVRQLAQIGVDLIHPEGAPPFLIRGYQAEQQIVRKWEKQYKVPVVTSAMTQIDAFRAMGMKKFLGITYHQDQKLNDLFARYFVEAGFKGVAIEGMPVERARAESLSAEATYAHIKRIFLRHRSVDGIYLQGSGTWRPIDVVPLEEDLNVPVIHPVAARVWWVQKSLKIRRSLKGAGRLLEQMPLM